MERLCKLHYSQSRLMPGLQEGLPNRKGREVGLDSLGKQPLFLYSGGSEKK
jgi:hypothetical protein